MQKSTQIMSKLTEFSQQSTPMQTVLRSRKRTSPESQKTSTIPFWLPLFSLKGNHYPDFYSFACFKRYRNGIKPYVFFCIWILSFNIL